MSTPKDGGPITSSVQPDGSNGLIAIGGLSKREYFAAMAMQGILANTQSAAAAESLCGEASVSRAAVKVADALLVALTKEVAS